MDKSTPLYDDHLAPLLTLSNWLLNRFSTRQYLRWRLACGGKWSNCSLTDEGLGKLTSMTEQRKFPVLLEHCHQSEGATWRYVIAFQCYFSVSVELLALASGHSGWIKSPYSISWRYPQTQRVIGLQLSCICCVIMLTDYYLPLLYQKCIFVAIGCYPRCPPNKPVYIEETNSCETEDECGCYYEGHYYSPLATIPLLSNGLCQEWYVRRQDYWQL